jgi:transposase
MHGTPPVSIYIRRGSMNERYREFRRSAGGAWEARRRIVECARAHGAEAATAMSGACRNAVYRLLQVSGDGEPPRLRQGRPPISPEEEAGIIDARLAHPGVGWERLRRDFDLPYGRHAVTRVLREVGLVPGRKGPTRDPEFWLRWRQKRLEVARLELMVAKVMRNHGVTGRIAQVERLRRAVARAERKVEWWTARGREAKGGAAPAVDVPSASSAANDAATASNADTATASNAENAKDAEDGKTGKLEGSGYVSLREMLGGLDVLGALGVE